MARRSRLSLRDAFLAASGCVLASALVLLTGAGSGGCQSPTQVTVELRTLGALPCTSLKGVSIVVAQTPREAEDRMKLGSLSADVPRGECNADGHTIGTLVITPSNDTGAIIVRARISDAPDASCVPPDYKGCIVARRSFSFITHASVTLPITLEASCLDVPCDVESSCRSGVCVSSSASCSDGASSCASIAEPVPDKDGGVVPPPDASVISVPDGSLPDGAPRDGAMLDGPPLGDGAPDALPDTKPDGPPSGNGLCPTNNGDLDCPTLGSMDALCCNDIAKGFVCTSDTLCPSTYQHYYCTGPAQCGGGKCCAGMPIVDAGMEAGSDASSAPSFVAQCYGAGTACPAGTTVVCGSSATCPDLAPNCTKILGSSNSHFILGCE